MLTTPHKRADIIRQVLAPVGCWRGRIQGRRAAISRFGRKITWSVWARGKVKPAATGEAINTWDAIENIECAQLETTAMKKKEVRKPLAPQGKGKKARKQGLGAKVEQAIADAKAKKPAVKKVKAAAESKPAKALATERRQARPQPLIEGYRMTQVIAFLGANGFKPAEAKAALIKVTGSAPTTDKTIAAFIYLGKAGKRPVAPLAGTELGRKLIAANEEEAKTAAAASEK